MKQLYINAAVLFAAIWVVLYSSLFTNFPQGLIDSVRTYGYWFETSGNAKQYEFGDTLNLDITATLSSAIQR